MKIYLVLKPESEREEVSVIAAYKDSQRAYDLVEMTYRDEDHGRDDLWVQEIDFQE